MTILTQPSVLPTANDACWCGSGRKYKRCHKPLEGRVASVREVVDCEGANIISNEIFALNSQGELLRTFPLREATRELLSTFGYDDERCLP